MPNFGEIRPSPAQTISWYDDAYKGLRVADKAMSYQSFLESHLRLFADSHDLDVGNHSTTPKWVV